MLAGNCKLDFDRLHLTICMHACSATLTYISALVGDEQAQVWVAPICDQCAENQFFDLTEHRCRG